MALDTLYIQIVLAIVASGGNNIGKALQKDGAARLPNLGFNTMVQYLTAPVWLLGIGLDIGGALLMVSVLALPGAQISVIQPASGLGLVALAIYSHFFQEAISSPEWGGAVLASLGIVALGYTAAHARHHDVQYTCAQAALLMACWACVGVFWTMRLAATKSGSFRRRSSGIVPKSRISRSGQQQLSGILLGLQAGACFGTSAACTRLGFLMSGRHSAMAALGLGFSLNFSSTGIVLQTAAFRHCGAVIICVACTVAAMLAGLTLGVGFLGEELPQGAGLRSLVLASWAAILGGLGLLAAHSSQKSGSGESAHKARESALRSRAGRSWSEALRESTRWRTWVPVSWQRWFSGKRTTISLDLLPRHNSGRAGLRVDHGD